MTIVYSSRTEFANVDKLSQGVECCDETVLDARDVSLDRERVTKGTCRKCGKVWTLRTGPA